MSNLALNVSNISKKFKTDFWKKQFTALTDVSFQVPENSICGLIGPNGAGKTTAIKIILGFIQTNSGKVEIFGEDARSEKTHERVGYLPEQAYYYDYLNPVEFLNFYAQLFNLPNEVKKERVESLLKLVGLSDRKDSKLRSFSKGMLQRVGIAQALINDPQLVILDEPMSGLDPIGRKEVRDIIVQLKERGKTVLFSTHILSDVENLCDYAVMIVKGQMKASGPIDQLIQPEVQAFDLEIADSNVSVPSSWINHAQMKQFPQKTVIRFTKTSEIHTDSILDWVQKSKIPLVSFIPYKESLEDVLVRNMEKARHV